MAVTNGQIGFGGTLVASAMESLGYRYQSYIIDQFSSSFFGELGGFIYLIGIVVAVFGFATRGSYKFTPWLLIGPSLFFAMINMREPAENTVWKFAKKTREQVKVDEQVRRSTTAAGAGGLGVALADSTKPRVSSTFAFYDKMISSAVQEISEIIVGKKDDSRDRLFLVRAQLAARLHNTGVEDKNFYSLVQIAFSDQCHRAIYHAEVLNNPLSTRTQLDIARLEIDNFTKETLKGTRLNAAAAAYVASVQLKNALGGLVGGLGLATYRGNVEAERKLTGELTDKVFSCKQIWQWVEAGIKDRGALEMNLVTEMAKSNNIPINDLLKSLGKIFGLSWTSEQQSNTAGNLQTLANITAFYILRNTYRNPSSMGSIDRVSGKTSTLPHFQAPIEQEMLLTEKARTDRSEWSEKTRLMVAATNLPYYQGLLLFFLAATFPFFAMTLLVPGKHGAFFTWFVLWLWVKSWDVGMAIVASMDNILFEIMGQNSANSSAQLVGVGFDSVTNGIGAVSYLLKHSDPTFNLSTYYNIIAVSILAIPVISSQLLFGLMTGGAGLINSSTNTIGDGFSISALNYASQIAISNLKTEQSDLRMKVAALSQNGMLGLSMYGESGQSGGVALGADGNGRPMVAPVNGWQRTPGSMQVDSSRYVPHGDPSYSGGEGAFYDPSDPEKKRPSYALQRQGFQTSMDQQFKEFTSAKKIASALTGFASPGGFDFSFFGKLFGKRMGGYGETTAGIAPVLTGARGVAKADGDFQNKIIGLNLTRMEKDRGLVSAYADYDTVHGERGRRLTYLIKLYGSFEIPITADNPVDRVASDRLIDMQMLEYDYEISYHQMRAGYDQAAIDALGKFNARDQYRKSFLDAKNKQGVNPWALDWSRRSEFGKKNALNLMLKK